MRLAQFYDLRLTGAIDVLDKTVEHLLEPSANRTLLRCVVYLFHIRTGYVPETNRQRRTGLPDAARGKNTVNPCRIQREKEVLQLLHSRDFPERLAVLLPAPARFLACRLSTMFPGLNLLILSRR